MKCLLYALRQWRKEGGYLCIRRSRAFRFPFPHFLHAGGLQQCSHMTAAKPHGTWWKDLLCVLTGRNYRLKQGDE